MPGELRYWPALPLPWRLGSLPQFAVRSIVVLLLRQSPASPQGSTSLHLTPLPNCLQQLGYPPTWSPHSSPPHTRTEDSRQVDHPLTRTPAKDRWDKAQNTCRNSHTTALLPIPTLRFPNTPALATV